MFTDRPGDRRLSVVEHIIWPIAMVRNRYLAIHRKNTPEKTPSEWAEIDQSPS